MNIFLISGHWWQSFALNVGICVDVVGQLMGGVEDSTIVVDRSMWNDAI